MLYHAVNVSQLDKESRAELYIVIHVPVISVLTHTLVHTGARSCESVETKVCSNNHHGGYIYNVLSVRGSDSHRVDQRHARTVGVQLLLIRIMLTLLALPTVR